MSTIKYPLRNVMVIGGCGFLGHHIVRLLIEQHPESRVSVLDLNTNLNRVDGVDYYNGDITIRDDLVSILRKTDTDTIINTVSPLAAVGNVAAKIFYKVNVEGTKTTLDAAQEANVKIYIYTSSPSIITDNVTDRRNVDENYPVIENNSDAYADSKAKGEAIVLEANGKNGLRTCSLRVCGLFGPGDRQSIPGMLSVLKAGQTKFQLGNNDNLFDFTYIENAAFAHILAAERLLHPDPEKKVDGEVFFITNGEPVYFWDFPRAIWGYYGHVAPYHIKLPFAIGVIFATASEFYSYLVGKEPTFTRFRVNYTCRHRYFNISKARQRLDYQPLVSLYDGMIKTCKWIEGIEQKKVEKDKIVGHP